MLNQVQHGRTSSASRRYIAMLSVVLTLVRNLGLTQKQYGTDLLLVFVLKLAGFSAVRSKCKLAQENAPKVPNLFGITDDITSYLYLLVTALKDNVLETYFFKNAKIL